MNVLSVQHENIPSIKYHKRPIKDGQKRCAFYLSTETESVVNYSLRFDSKSLSRRKFDALLKVPTHVSNSKIDTHTLPHLIEIIQEQIISVTEQRKCVTLHDNLYMIALCIVPMTVELTRTLEQVNNASQSKFTVNSYYSNKFLFLIEILIEFIWVDHIRALCREEIHKDHTHSNYKIRYNMTMLVEDPDSVLSRIYYRWSKLNYFPITLLSSLKFTVIGEGKNVEIGYRDETRKIVLSTLLLVSKKCFVQFMKIVMAQQALYQNLDEACFLLMCEWLLKGTVQSNSGESVVGIRQVLLDLVNAKDGSLLSEHLGFRCRCNTWAKQLSTRLIENKTKEDVIQGTEIEDTDLKFNKYEVALLFLDDLIRTTATVHSVGTSQEDSNIQDEHTQELTHRPLEWMSVFNSCSYHSGNAIKHRKRSQLQNWFKKHTLMRRIIKVFKNLRSS
ncbi:hypothetical protein J6895_01680 [Nakaseomyces glabratus]|nr:hypothetical protein J6895_01680 [Nakaseomyces glabratus]